MEEEYQEDIDNNLVEANGSEYLSQLQAEIDSIDPSFTAARSLLETEITRVKSGNATDSKESKKYVEAHKETPVKLSVYVLLPTKEYPKVNFVGKLLGPGGNSLKRLQQDSGTKMAIQGRGSMRDKEKEEELRQEGDPKYAHLHDNLHLRIDAFAPVHMAYSRIGSALEAIQPYLSPEMHDAISQEQMAQLARARGGDTRRGAMMDLQGRGDSIYGRDPLPARSYEEFRGREYAGDVYDRVDSRGPPRDYYDGFQPRAAESRERFGSKGGWSSQGNGFSGAGYSSSYSGSFGKSRGAARGGERQHPYGRGRGTTY